MTDLLTARSRMAISLGLRIAAAAQRSLILLGWLLVQHPFVVPPGARLPLDEQHHAVSLPHDSGDVDGRQ